MAVGGPYYSKGRLLPLVLEPGQRIKQLPLPVVLFSLLQSR